ncbi:hypothetical protein ISF_08634 [Cordyceps fumosorosea ARSEF 2679]|uniref:Esterase, SGNH hydrolase-type n=1 Tax=Cordyceps fumosorosea (strain ARSEF 2679) TaxID=1081104 RepID=A0A162I8F4_CORFA|nr:hypothetical protein ISF_08634 [Cordyceps fumosorosea ARSEF 2679]OAA53695.1 hypothetical protein ISF_08634 [Cordyceps fumosorosea ARSEF 2679]
MTSKSVLAGGGQFVASLRFVSHRLLRTTPRLTAQIAICFIFVYFLATFTPTSLFWEGYENILPWGSFNPSITKSTDDVRVVVFGSQDVFGSAVPASDSSRSSWTLQLCKEMGCTSYRSLVPPENAQPALTSNQIYQTAVDEFLASVEGADLLESPASDYEFLKSQYPVPTVSDLTSQVRQFLSTPPERTQSRSTVWIFSFGTWEVWNLAALPIETANDVLDDMVQHIFQQVELLYLKALNPKSIAFSSFWTGMSSKSMKKLMAPTAPQKIDDRALESFRILVPQLFDMTLAPVWQTRPMPPYPHTRAEHMRNAVALTQRWNRQVERQMAAWQDKGRSKPDGVDKEQVLNTSEQPTSDSAIKDFVDALPVDMRPKTGAVNLAFAPYPKRLGSQLATVTGMTDLMMNAAMRQSGAYDSAGNGAPAANESLLFANTWDPCFASAMDIPGQGERDETSCSAPDDYLFHDAATLNQRAVDDVASRMARLVLEGLFPPLRK